MKQRNILIAEDDQVFAIEIESLLEQIGYREFITVDNGIDAMRVIKKHQPDLLLLDVFLKGDVTGIKVAEEVKDMGVPVIFFTVSKERAVFESTLHLYPAAFLVKPFSMLSLESAINVALKKRVELSSNSRVEGDLLFEDAFFIRKRSMLLKVNLSEVQLVKAEGNYCVLDTSKDSFVVKSSLSRLRAKLPPNRFIQIHRNYIIQTKLLEKVDIRNNEIYVGDRLVPIGKTFKESLIQNLKLL